MTRISTHMQALRAQLMALDQMRCEHLAEDEALRKEAVHLLQTEIRRWDELRMSTELKAIQDKAGRSSGQGAPTMRPAIARRRQSIDRTQRDSQIDRGAAKIRMRCQFAIGHLADAIKEIESWSISPREALVPPEFSIILDQPHAYWCRGIPKESLALYYPDAPRTGQRIGNEASQMRVIDELAAVVGLRICSAGSNGLRYPSYLVPARRPRAPSTTPSEQMLPILGLIEEVRTSGQRAQRNPLRELWKIELRDRAVDPDRGVDIHIAAVLQSLLDGIELQPQAHSLESRSLTQ